MAKRTESKKNHVGVVQMIKQKTENKTTKNL